MRAALIRRHGGPEVLEVVDDLPEPGPAEGEAVVALHAGGMNRLDLFIRQGLTGPGVRGPERLPHVTGAEGAGVVTELRGDPPPGIAVGSRVMVFPGLSCRWCRFCRTGRTSRCSRYRILGEDVWGVHRSRIVLPVDRLLPVPEHLTTTEAAVVPVAHTTAWTMLMTAARLQVGERVLVVGGSGGVAVAAAQLAHAAGAQVLVTTRSARKAETLRALPFVDDVLVTPRPGWSAEALDRTDGEGFDVVADAVGAPTWPDAIRSLATGGRMVICGATGGDVPQISIRELYQSHRQILGAPFGGWADFQAVVAMLAATGLRPVVDRELPLADVAEAHRLLEAGQQLGKIALDLR